MILSSQIPKVAAAKLPITLDRIGNRAECPNGCLTNLDWLPSEVATGAPLSGWATTTGAAVPLRIDRSGSVPPTWFTPILEGADMKRVRLGSESSGSTDVVRFAVGTWIRWVRAGRAFGRLSATRDQLVVSAAYRKAVLQRVHVRGIYVRTILFRQSIVFDTDNGSGDGVLVYGWGIRRILEALSDLGWPVSE